MGMVEDKTQDSQEPRAWDAAGREEIKQETKKQLTSPEQGTRSDDTDKKPTFLHAK